MSVFRPKTIGNPALSNGIDWFTSNQYSSSVIATFPDPDGGKGNEPTSIPSPFARLDLVRTAFKYLNEGADLNSTFGKIVSDSLDVAEIFFNYKRLKKSFNIIIHEWDKTNDLSLLKGITSSKEHKLLGEALGLYLAQDANSFNFNLVDKFYVLEFQNRVIGGTSPVTLFFSSANDLSWVNISFPNGDKAFDASYCPLHKRDPDFQKMLYSMRAHDSRFVSMFRELSTYMDRSLNELQNTDISLYNQINQIIRTNGSNYNTAHYDSIDNGVFITRGLPYYTSKNTVLPVRSDFEIQSAKYQGSIKPLVLKKGFNGIRPNGTRMTYYTAPYDQSIQVPDHDEEQNLNNRFLPGLTAINYPYLTIGDFLENDLIRTIFPINQYGFFTGIQIQSNKGYVLPLKKMFFSFFDISDLKGTTSDGKPIFELHEGVHDQVNVNLRIPLKNGDYIEYEKTYYPNQNDRQNPISRGKIVEFHFSLSVFPSFQLKEPVMNYYRVGLIETDTHPNRRNSNYSLEFFKSDLGKTKVTACQRRSEKSTTNINSYHYVIDNDNFDLIELSIDSLKGIIIPEFKQIEQGHQPSVFSIDFGTTNTHIEYHIGNTNVDPQPFKIDESDVQIMFFHNVELKEIDPTSYELWRIVSRFLHETMPKYVSNDSDYEFPLRTAISSKTNLNILGSTFTLGDLNIPFYYEKTIYQRHIDKVIKNLKWDSTLQGNEKYIKHLFENIIFLIRNKVLLNGGDLNRVRLICSHPTSMLSYRRALLQEKWNEVYHRLISNNSLPGFISESIAPFYYLQKRGGVAAVNRPVVSIDIGGETTDFVVFVDSQPNLISSVRFATNAIFGDGFNCNPSTNGFLLKFIDEIVRLIGLNDQNNLTKLIKNEAQSNNSTDLINLFFAIENNRNRNNSNLSFSELLKGDTQFKLIFVLFYSSLVYHIAKIMKLVGLSSPAYLSFSGMGSKVLNIIGDNPLKLLTESVFASILGTANLQIKKHLNPKEVTAKGSLYYIIDYEGDASIDMQRKVLLGDEDNTLISSEDDFSYSNLNDEKYSNVLEEYLNFIRFFESLNKKMNFRNNFGFSVDEFKKHKKLLTDRDKVLEFIKIGVQHKIEQLNNQENEPIEETLFFYPLIGMLNLLAYEISKSS